MPAATAGAIIGDSFAVLNIFLPGESVPAADGAFALRQLNYIVRSWRQQRQTVPVVVRELFDMTSGKGSPTNPYTIGPSGDLNTTPKPSNQNSIVAANLVLTAADPDVRVPLGIFTTDAYNALTVPALTSTQPTGLFYNPTYSSGLGSVYLWPVPDNGTNDLELFIQKPLAEFADLGTSYYMPDGYDDALLYALAQRLSGPYGKELGAEDKRLAVASLSLLKRSNLQLSDLVNDAYWATMGRQGVYNIVTGQGG